MNCECKISTDETSYSSDEIGEKMSSEDFTEVETRERQFCD